MGRAQASVEFVIILAVLLIILVALVSVSAPRRAQARMLQGTLEAGQVGDAVSAIAHRLVLLGNGTQESQYIPATIHSQEYDIAFDNVSALLLVSWGSSVYTVPLPMQLNTTVIPTGRVVVFTNEGGEIYVG